jgi:hypothetical protein
VILAGEILEVDEVAADFLPRAVGELDLELMTLKSYITRCY